MESISAISSQTLSSQSTTVPPTKSKPLATIASTPSSTAQPVASLEPENPWLNIQSSSSSKIARKKNEIIVGKSSGPAEKSNNRLRKHQEKHGNEREKAKHDAVVEISMNTILNLQPEESEQVDLPSVSEVKGKAKVVTQTEADSDEDSGENSEVEDQERRLTEKKRKGKGKAKDQGVAKPFVQRDLVSLAFAGDKVVQVCFPPICFIEICVFYSFVCRTSKRLNNGRSSKMCRRKWIQPYLDGCAPFSTFNALSASSIELF